MGVVASVIAGFFDYLRMKRMKGFEEQVVSINGGCSVYRNS